MGQVFIAPEPMPHGLPGKLVFLAGPIQGARDWQSYAIRRLRQIAPGLHVASPRAATFDGDFDRQVDWETTHLRRAGANGAILFWLGREAEHRCDRAYAQTTRFEAGEWFARSLMPGASVVVGIERGFTGERYIRRRIALTYPNIPICTTLQQTCAVAAEMCGVKFLAAAGLYSQEE